MNDMLDTPANYIRTNKTKIRSMQLNIRFNTLDEEKIRKFSLS